MPKKEEQPDDEAESLEGEFLEVSLQELARMMAETAHYDSNWSLENESKPEKGYRFWYNTPMGYREVDRVYIRLSDTIAEQELPDEPPN